MPMFGHRTSPHPKSGQMQDVICPRCREALEPIQNTSYGDGAQTRIVESEYKHACGYEVKVIERIPVINRATDDERHI